MNKFQQFSGFGFQPLNHKKQKMGKMFPNNNHERTITGYLLDGVGSHG